MQKVKIVEAVRSEFLSITKNEVVRSVFTGFATTLILGLVTLADGGKHVPTFHELWLLLWAAISATLGDIARRLLTNSQGKVLKKEPDAAKQDNTAPQQ